jgi:hypothetical protein
MPKCLEDGCLRIVKGSRCPEHSGRPWYRGDWPEFARSVLDSWAARYGPLCVGWKREPHMVTRSALCLDHLDAHSFSRDPADYQPLCRSCNGAKGDRVDGLEGTDLRR